MVEDFQAQCEQFGLGDNWAVIYDDREFFGMKERHVRSLCGDCALLINLCGALKTTISCAAPNAAPTSISIPASRKSGPTNGTWA